MSGPQETVPLPSKWTLKVSARQLELQGMAITLTEKEWQLPASADDQHPSGAAPGHRGPASAATIRTPAAGSDMLVYRLRKKARTGQGQDLPLRSAYGEGYSLSASFNLS